MKMMTDYILLKKAIKYNKVDIIRTLVKKHKHTKFTKGKSPLYLAIRYNRPRIVDILLKYYRVDINDHSALDGTVLHAACISYSQNANIIRKLILHGAQVNEANYLGATPILLCSVHGNINIFKLLLKYGANLLCQDNRGQTPLYFITSRRHDDITEFLVNLNKLEQIPLDPTVIKENGEKFINPDLMKLLWDYTDISQLCMGDIFFILDVIFSQDEINYPLLSHILKDPTFQLKLNIYEKGVLAGILNYDDFNIPFGFLEEEFQEIEDMVDQIDYNRYEDKYNKFFGCLVESGVKLVDMDVIAFLIYFRHCPYKIQLLNRLLELESKISSWMIVHSCRFSKNNIQITTMLLEHCANFDIVAAYKEIIEHMNWFSAEIIILFCSFFTPRSYWSCETGNYLFFLRIDIDHYELIRRFKKRIDRATCTVPSLQEMSRDIIRKTILSVSKSNKEFFERIDKLIISSVIKDVIKLKMPVNNY